MQGWIQRQIIRGVLGYRNKILFVRRADLDIFKAVFCEKPKIARRRRVFLKNGLFVLILGYFWAIFSTRRMDLDIFKAVFCENPKMARHRRFF